MISRTILALACCVAARAALSQNYPDAAQCAAYWLGRADYADVSTYLTGEAEARALGEAFRRAALRLSHDRAQTDALIADQRPLMSLLSEAYIYGGDEQSREISERLVQGCENLAADLPETGDLR